MKKHCVLALLLSCWVFTSLKPLDTQRAEAVIAFESFEGTASELGYTVDNWRDGFSDYFDRVSNVNSGNPAPTGGYHIHTGIPANIHDDGTGDQYFFASDDLDDDGNPRTDDLGVITFDNVDVSSATDLKLKLLLGVDRADRFETDDYLQIYYALDGDITPHPGTTTAFSQGDYTLLADFRGSGSGTNASQDADFNGVGDGSVILPFGTTGSGANNDLIMSDLSFDIPSTGTSLSIRIVIATDGADETFILDNLRVTGSLAPTAPNSATLSATTFLEGAYNGSGMNTLLKSQGLVPTTAPYNGVNGHTGSESVASEGDIRNNAVDWVLIQLRESSSGATVGSAAGFLMSDGSVKATDGVNDLTVSLSGNSGAAFYMVVYHRNHLPIMSASAISESGGTYTIDFTTSQGQAFGTTPMAEVTTGVYGMIAGDQNSDGQVNSTDLTNWRLQNGGPFSYAGSTADFNLDGQVNAVDRNDFQQKNFNRSSQVPTN